MPQEYKHAKVRSRNEQFAQRTATHIWAEAPNDVNPYIAETALCHGYDLFDLMEKRSFPDVFYLLFRGDLPTTLESQLLQRLMIALINPGPRHPATRAAMNVGVGKTNPMHILPIASALLGGHYLGGGEVEEAMHFFQRMKGEDANVYAKTVLDQLEEIGNNHNRQNIPGFGTRHGSVDILATKIASQLLKLDGAGPSLKWGRELTSLLEPHGLSWLTTGVAAAVFTDLGFQPRTGACLFQLISSCGAIAHGLELASKPIHAMPFVSDENYVIER